MKGLLNTSREQLNMPEMKNNAKNNSTTVCLMMKLK